MQKAVDGQDTAVRESPKRWIPGGVVGTHLQETPFHCSTAGTVEPVVPPRIAPTATQLSAAGHDTPPRPYSKYGSPGDCQVTHTGAGPVTCAAATLWVTATVPTDATSVRINEM